MSVSELPSMIATLNSYESMFGPYHVQTLALTVQIARVLWSVGEARAAQRLSERSVKCLARGRDEASSLRVAALTTLRELFLEQGDSAKAIAVQREIVECLTRLAGADDPRVANEKTGLAKMLLEATHKESNHTSIVGGLGRSGAYV
jgi:hypothetical protein